MLASKLKTAIKIKRIQSVWQDSPQFSVASANGLLCSHGKARQIRWQDTFGWRPTEPNRKKRSCKLILQFLKKILKTNNRKDAQRPTTSVWRKCASGGDLQTDLIKCEGQCVAKKPVGFSSTAGTGKEVWKKVASGQKSDELPLEIICSAQQWWGLQHRVRPASCR